MSRYFKVYVERVRCIPSSTSKYKQIEVYFQTYVNFKCYF